MATKLIKGQIKQWEEPIGVMNAQFVAAHSDVRQDLKWQDAILVIGDERMFTESEVRAMLREIEEDYHTEASRQQFVNIAKAHGIVLDPA